MFQHRNSTARSNPSSNTLNASDRLNRRVSTGASRARTIRGLTIAAVAGLSLAALPSTASAAASRPAVSPDFHVSGTVTPEDLFVYLEYWFAGKEKADIDGDRTLSIWDIMQFVQMWFAARDAGPEPKDPRTSADVDQSDDTR